MFAECLNRNADQTLFICDNGTKFSYSDALELSRRVEFKDTKRRLVFCLSANLPGALLGYLGLMVVGAVPIMLNANIPNWQLAKLVNIYLPDFIWMPQERIDELNGARAVFMSSGYAMMSFGKKDLHTLHDDLALLLGTSGSTGSPKLVRLSLQNIISNSQSISEYLLLTSDEIPITTLPPSYSYGLSILHSHILRGCTIALTNRTFFDRGFWDFLQKSQATSMGGVPYHYEMLKKLGFSKLKLPALRTLTQAGGRLNPELGSEFANLCARRGMRFFIMYGQAEATARLSYLSPEKAILKPNSIGQSIPGGRFWLEDESGSIQYDGNLPGELVYQGNNVCMGYAENQQDLIKGDELGGILRTGDVARRDIDGDYYIVGRLKRFLKLFGHRVSLQDIEDELQAMGLAAACAGKDDQLDVFLSNANHDLANLIKSKLIEKLMLPPSSVRVFNVEQFPRNEAGKILYSELSQLIPDTIK
jgi:acyl-CoA synthetase (AMP-forming)/AMP-acid ligase II